MLTEHRDLRGGTTTWEDGQWSPPAADPLPTSRCDVAIIGGGIMGSILAERLSADGRSVVVLDRRPPGMGSTAASTAELMWAMDVPLVELAASLGLPEAARRWRRVYAAVRNLAARIDALGIDCDRVDRPTVYLAGGSLDAVGLRQEGDLHRRCGLPSAFLDADAASRRFGMAPRAALVSDGGFEVDPVKLAHGLLAAAQGRGTAVCYPCDVVSVGEEAGCVTLRLATGETVEAGDLVLANGYERAGLFLPEEFSLLSTFVMATPPGLAPLWRENAMIWEASDPYLYIRTDKDGRIIVGGEDEDFVDAAHRDARIGEKAGTIAAKVGALLGTKTLTVDRAWAATFGASPDGLPAIGRAANMQRVWLSAGFGGNGIAFAQLSAEILSAALQGTTDPDADCFDPYRFRTQKGCGLP